MFANVGACLTDSSKTCCPQSFTFLNTNYKVVYPLLFTVFKFISACTMLLKTLWTWWESERNINLQTVRQFIHELTWILYWCSPRSHSSLNLGQGIQFTLFIFCSSRCVWMNLSTLWFGGRVHCVLTSPNENVVKHIFYSKENM